MDKLSSVDVPDRDEDDASPEAALEDGARMHRFDPKTASVAQAIVQYSLERIRLDPPPIGGPASQHDLDKYGPTVTPEGIGGMEALGLFRETLAPATISQDHPRNWSFVPGAPTEAAVLFDLVVGASSIYGGSWMEGAGAVWAENQALRWIADLAGFPDTAGGVFVTGGTAGNLGALVAARDRALRLCDGQRPTRWFVLSSQGAHSSIAAACRVMDVGVLTVATDSGGHMRADGLALATAEARRDGIAVGPDDTGEGGRVFALVATGGTTNAGVIDDLYAAADASLTHGLWLHVDGAYGGAALCAPSVRERFNGIEHADSLVVDPHKWLFAPYDCAALIYRDPDVARHAHTQHAGYLEVLQDDGEWNPSDYAFHLTRRARGLPFWYSLATHGTDAYRDAVEASLTLTRQVADEIESRPSLELLARPELSVLLFRRLGWSAAQYHEWSDVMLVEQRTFTVPTTVKGAPGTPPETLLRFCFTHPRTTLKDVVGVLETLD